MDNVILKLVTNFDGVIINPSKRIKLSELSASNVRAKLDSLSQSKIISIPLQYLEQANKDKRKIISIPLQSLEQANNDKRKIISIPLQSLEQANQSVAINNGGHNTAPYATQNQSSIVNDNIILGDCSRYTSQIFTTEGSRLIRLTDVMYARVVNNADTSSFDDTFSALSTENIVNSGSTGVKKAAYSKAKVEKYGNEKLPTNMLTDNGLFDTFSTSSREVPIVVSERPEKFLFNDLADVVETGERPVEMNEENISLDLLQTIKNTSGEDLDIESLLADVAKFQKEENDSKNKMAAAKREFQSSAQLLKTAAQRYSDSSQALANVTAQAYAYLDEIKNNIGNNIKRTEEFAAMTEQQKREAQRIGVAADKIEARVQEFNNVLAVAPNSKEHGEDKTYSRGYNIAA